MRSLLIVLLSCVTASAADLYLYHDPLCPSTHDRLFYEAVAEPMPSLRKRLPDHQPMRDYLAELSAARQELRSLGNVTIQTRDEARLKFDQPTPSYALSAYEPPRSITPEAFLHPVLIVRHLCYLSRIADLGMERRGFAYYDPDDAPRECKWLEWRMVSTCEYPLADLRIVEELEVLTPKVPPVPAVDVPRPYRMCVLTYGCDADGDEWCVTERYEIQYDATMGELLRGLDHGSGIVMQEPCEPEPEFELPIGPPAPVLRRE